MPSRSNDAGRSALDRAGRLRRDAEHARGPRRPAVPRARSSRPRTGRRRSARTRPCRAGWRRRCAGACRAPGCCVRARRGRRSPCRDVAGLEEPDQRRQPREALRVGIGATDEREDLELALEVRAVVGEHVHEVVLREVRRVRRRAFPGSAKPRPSYISHTAAPERPCGQVRERRPPRRELGVDLRRLERVGALRRASAPARRRRPRGRARRSRCAGGPSTPARTRPARSGARRARSRPSRRAPRRTSPPGARRRPGSAAARARRAPCGGRSAGGSSRSRPARTSASSSRPERLERPVVDRDPGERSGDRLEQVRLHVGEAALGRHRGRDAPGDERHLVGVVVGARAHIQVHRMSPPPLSGTQKVGTACRTSTGRVGPSELLLADLAEEVGRVEVGSAR